MAGLALLLLAGSSHALGTLALQAVDWRGVTWWERWALVLTTGLGFTAIVLAVLLLAGAFAWSTAVLALLSTVAVWRGFRDHSSPAASHPDRYLLIAFAAIVAACVGAIAPVTDSDALTYVVPAAERVAAMGQLDVWPDMARTMWPLSQQVLLAYLIDVGGQERLGLLTAFELLLCFGSLSALARRACDTPHNGGLAIIIALGCPAIAFLAASGKEDLLVVAGTAGAAFFLSGVAPHFAAAGIFAGVAAGAKYPGLAVAVAAVAWVIVSSRSARFSNAATVIGWALAMGGLWYFLNILRFANPVAPFLFGAAGTPIDGAVASAFTSGYGLGSHRTPLTFVLAPVQIFVDPDPFCGRANLFNPLSYIGLLIFWRGDWRRHAPLLFMAAVLYVSWFFTLQNARLLLPAVVLLAVPASDVVMSVVATRRVAAAGLAVIVALSIGVVAAVGVVRITRYASDPSRFAENETQHYVDIQWMRTHLDPLRHRVASARYGLAYLTVPHIYMDPTYQTEISAAELEDPVRFLAACRRQGITHLFGNEEVFASLGNSVRLVYRNPSSRLGGVRFFREPPTEPTAVFELIH